MASSSMEDDGGNKLLATAKDLVAKGEFIKALVITEDLRSAYREDKVPWRLRHQQGSVFLKLAIKAENPVVRIAFLLASVDCFSEDADLSPVCAKTFQELAKLIGSLLYYKKSVEKAKQGLSVVHQHNARGSLDEQRLWNKQNLAMVAIIKDAESKIASPNTIVVKNYEPKVLESKKSPEPSSKDEFKGLRSYWLGLDVEIKRDLMKVSIAKLRSFVEGVHNSEGRDALEKVLAFAKQHKKWQFWMCRTLCSKEFHSAEDCKSHLEQQHAADFKPSSETDMVKRIGKDWARKISSGGWEPVDAVAAAVMMQNQLEYVKAFTSESKRKGWSKEWPLAADEERRELLKEIKLLLVTLCDHKVLSSSIRVWLMEFPVEHLLTLGVSKESITDSQLKETPQSICFLEGHELNQIQDLLKKIKCERDDGTDHVCRAVDRFWDGTRVKETIDFDSKFSLVLLDKRLLKSSKYAPFDDAGKISFIDNPNVHYAEAKAQGDHIISWLVDYSSVDESFPKPIREHNLDIWVAVLRAVQFTCKTLRTKYAKKKQFSEYEAALTEVKNLCMSECERRRNLQEDQWNRYASLLCDECEEKVRGNSPTTKLFLCAVRDVFEGALHPTFDSDGCLSLIRERKSVNDDSVLMSIDLLKSAVTHKVLLIDSKILLIDNSRIRLLDNLTKLSVFDYRSYMLRLVKPFLLTKAKSDAAEADLLLEEEKKSQAKKKKENKNKKRTSTSMSTPLDKTVEHDLFVSEPRGTSPSQITMEEDSVKPEDTFASEKGGLEISSSTDIRDEPTKVDQDMQNMPEEDSLAGNLESALGGAAARYNSALDMTLKALVNINVLKEDLKQPFHDDQGEQVPLALQNFFTAFSSDEIKTEGVYSVILSDLHASLEEVTSVDRLSSDAAEVLVNILEFWHCWKNSERESLVTRLFTLEESERMSCRKCKKKPDYPKQKRYGIVTAAEFIRDLKCAFGSMKFADILKVIRLDYKMLCDIKTGGCGKTNSVHYTISRCPPIFTILIEWEKSESEKEISETTKALDLVIDISRLYKGLEPNTNYRLVSMVGCGEEEECICIAYEENRWVNLRRESLAGEEVGNWENVVRFCEEMKVRPEILFYEAA